MAKKTDRPKDNGPGLSGTERETPTTCVVCGGDLIKRQHRNGTLVLECLQSHDERLPHSLTIVIKAK